MAQQAIYELNNPQRLYVRYTIAVLVDLSVLNLFDEYWDLVTIESFTISFAVAIILQVLLRLTIAAEHRVADYFKSKPGVAWRIYRGLSTWAILIGSKFAMLEAIDFAFGDRVEFSGPLHGIVAFVAVIIAIILAEGALRRIFLALDDKGDILPDPVQT
jgi:hypothetical protein